MTVEELYYINVHGDTPLGFNECDNKGTKMITDGSNVWWSSDLSNPYDAYCKDIKHDMNLKQLNNTFFVFKIMD